MRHEIRTEIDIEAPPDEVWAQLADLDAYAGWNPFITTAEGAAEAGPTAVAPDAAGRAAAR